MLTRAGCFVALCLWLPIAASAAPRPPLPKRQAPIIMAVESSRDLWGTSVAYMIDYYRQIEEAIYKRIGLDVRFQFVNTGQKALDMLRQGQAIFGQIESITYLSGLEQGITMTPIRIFSPGNQPVAQVCLYALPQAKPLTAPMLKGKRLAVKLSRDYILMRNFMEAKGINATSGAFWKSIRRLPDDKSLLYSLTTHQADIAILTQSAYKIVINRPGNGFRNVKELFCVGKFPPVLIVGGSKSTTSAQLGINQVLGIIPTDPAFQSVSFLFKSTGATWQKIPPGFFNVYRQLYRKAMAKGWLSEYSRLPGGG